MRFACAGAFGCSHLLSAASKGGPARAAPSHSLCANLDNFSGRGGCVLLYDRRHLRTRPQRLSASPSCDSTPAFPLSAVRSLLCRTRVMLDRLVAPVSKDRGGKANGRLIPPKSPRMRSACRCNVHPAWQQPLLARRAHSVLQSATIHSLLYFTRCEWRSRTVFLAQFRPAEI